METTPVGLPGLQKLLKGSLFELFCWFFTVIINEIVNNAFFEAQFDGDALAENDLAFEDIVVCKNQFNAG